jgi:hypothetical protein
LPLTSLMLSADGFRLTMDLVPSSVSPGYRWLDATLAFKGAAQASSSALACHGSFTVEDLIRLADVIETHVQQLRTQSPWVPTGAPAIESITWVTYDLSVQIQCLAGEVEVEDGTLVGEFSMRVMLNLGKTVPSEHTLYGGFQGTIDVQQAMAFCAAVRNWAAYN